MAKPMDGGKAKTDAKATDKMDRAHMKPEKASTKRAVKKAEGPKGRMCDDKAMDAYSNRDERRKVRDT